MTRLVIRVDDHGNVSSRGHGSIEQQDTAAMLVAMYLQDRAEYKGSVARCVLQNKRVNEPDSVTVAVGMTD